MNTHIDYQPRENSLLFQQ